jgi:D-alanine-D-alanine ligase
MHKKLKVAVLMGGNSSEREVSLVSGKEVIKNLNKDKYEVMVIDVPKELPKLAVFKPDVAFLALHGRGGEDGQIQGYLETLGIKYTGCGILASAIGMDKMVFRRLMEEEGMMMANITDKIPCVVKPVDGGSSVGVSIVKDLKDYDKAVELAKLYDEDVLIEEYIEGIEVSCGVLGNQKVVALPVIEIVPKNEFFDYEAKYTEGKCQEICPARISEEMKNTVQKLAIETFKSIGGKGYARVDFIIKDNRPYILEINTLPGLTPNYLLPKEAAEAGISYPKLLDKMIELALE